MLDAIIKNCYNNRVKLYLFSEVDDDRVDAALEEIRPLGEPAAAPVTSEARVREIVRDEIGDE